MKNSLVGIMNMRTIMFIKNNENLSMLFHKPIISLPPISTRAILNTNG